MVPWKLWLSLPHVKLWEAVALVLDIEPSRLRESNDAWMMGPGKGPVFEHRSFPSPAKRDDFEKALNFAERAANVAGPIYLRTGLAVGMNKRTALVSLPEVAAFFVACDWPNIPSQLLALLPHSAALEPLIPATSPRDFRPWETLNAPEAHIEGLFFYHQAAREIADVQGWSDSRLQALLDAMASAINQGALRTRDRKTGLVFRTPNRDVLSLVTPDDVNNWLASQDAPYRWDPSPHSASDSDQPAVVSEAVKQRQTAEESWKPHAQKMAWEFIKEQEGLGYYPPQDTVSDRVAALMRKAGIFGFDGKPLSGGTIKRHALKGILSAKKKALSTKSNRGN